ncbi:hypothetical protein N7488_003873 [Penicillium malachiteum]|nr:hypothetical protein N7488_003873 [Penicillium malachiteum]
MQCTNHRIPYGIWRLRVFHEIFGPSYKSQSSRHFSTSKPCQDESKSQDETPIPPSQRLPQSPLITHPRPGPGKNLGPKLPPSTDGPEPLAKNPWAQALASPMRSCTVSGARLPRDLMGDWGLVQRPNTDDLYLLPVDYLKDSLQKNSKNGGEQEAVGKMDDTIKSGKISTRRQLVFKMLNVIPFLRLMMKPLGRPGGKKPPVSRLIPFRWRHPQGPITQREEKQLVWMDDMPQYLLRHMRKDLSKRLVSACLQSNTLGAANSVWSVIDMQGYSTSALLQGLQGLRSVTNMECGAVILLGEEQVEGDTGVAGPESFPESVTIPQVERGVPVFDLSVLLSTSELAELRQSVPHFQHSALFFRPNNKAVRDLMLSLWKLKQYLVEDPELERANLK